MWLPFRCFLLIFFYPTYVLLVRIMIVKYDNFIDVNLGGIGQPS